MPFVPNDEVAEVELFYVWDDQKCMNTLYFQSEETWDAAALLDLATVVANWAVDNIMPLMSATVSLNAVRALSLASETAPAVEYTAILPSVGGNNNPSLPNNVSLAIKFSTAGRGRSSRGRNYILGITEESVTANEVSTGFADAYVDAYEALLTVLASELSTVTWVVYSRFTGNAPRVTGLPQAITGVSFVDRTIDSMRRRLPGRGT